MSVHDAIRKAEKLLPGEPSPDGVGDPRWLAIIRVGRYIESDPEPIWAFVVRWGTHPQEDLRAAVACCLLEHLLEYHFELIFPRLREQVKHVPFLADTFLHCEKFGQAESKNWSAQFDRLRSQLLQRRRRSKASVSRGPRKKE